MVGIVESVTQRKAGGQVGGTRRNQMIRVKGKGDSIAGVANSHRRAAERGENSPHQQPTTTTTTTDTTCSASNPSHQPTLGSRSRYSTLRTLQSSIPTRPLSVVTTFSATPHLFFATRFSSLPYRLLLSTTTIRTDISPDIVITLLLIASSRSSCSTTRAGTGTSPMEDTGRTTGATPR